MSQETASIFQNNIDRGIQANIISISSDKTKITYNCSRICTFNYRNPEEKIRASYFSELVLDYQYPVKQIDIEVKVERRIPDDRADIVVYSDEKLQTPYLIVECKQDGIADAEFDQAIEQAFGNANSKRSKYTVVVAGTTTRAFNVSDFPSTERQSNIIADIPVKFGRAPKYRFIKGDAQKDLKLVSRKELMQTLQKCHTTVWQGGKLEPTTAFDEFSKLLFCKLKDEKDKPNGSYYDFQIGTHETPDELFTRVSSIYQAAKDEDEDVFKEDFKLSPKVVFSVVSHLQEIAINEIDLDTKGVAFERFMEDFFRGKMGQFFTPRALIHFCIELLSPNFKQKILDPACGSGGFLLNALDYVRKEVEANYNANQASIHWHNFAKENLFGIEINDKIARVCKMNMIIHDDGHTNIISTDGLDKFQKIDNINSKFKENSFDFILSNPPFGAKIKSIEKEEDYLKQYILGSKVKERKTQKTEILFIERCIEFLKPSTGIAAIILPDSIAINSSMQYVRDYLLEKTQIISIVSIPDYAFAHYGANVKSSIFLLRKRKDDEIITNYPIMMAIPEKIGYTATGKDDKSDLPHIVNYYKSFLISKERISIKPDFTDKVFVVFSDELKKRRIDPKGYTKKFKSLKEDIIRTKLPKEFLKKCIIANISGDWGLDVEDESVTDDYELCYVLRNTNFHNYFNLDFSDIAVRYIKSDKVEKLRLSKGDILVEKSGGSPVQPVGRVAYIDELPDDKPVVFSNFLQKIVVTEEWDKMYIYSFLKTLYHKNYMEYIQNQTTGIKNLLMDEFLSIQVIKPDIKDQEEIGKQYYEELIKAKERIHQAYRELDISRSDVEKKILK